jgi:hypothetical protein
MTGPIGDYLRELGDRLRTPPEETRRILAEAAEHLRDSVAAGLAAGLTPAEAAEAAISSFGSVPVVVRAHQTRRDRVARLAGDAGMSAWRLTGFFLLASFGWLLVLLIVTATRHDPGAGPGGAADRSSATVEWWPVSGPAGLLVLGGYYLVSRIRRRNGRPRRRLLGGYAPLTGIVGFSAVALTLMLLDSGGVTFPGQAGIGFGALGMTVGCTVRMLASQPPGAGPARDRTRP